MDYSIGKITNYNKTTGVGYIVTQTDKYMFTIDDLQGDKEQYDNGDIVRFRGETVYNTTNKAFFIKKLTMDNKSNH